MYVLIKGSDSEETTAGWTDKAVVGDIATVKLHDQNGMIIFATGAVVEVLEE